MAQYRVPIRFPRKLILFFFYFYPKSFSQLKWTNPLRSSQFVYFFFFWVSSKIKILGEIDKRTQKKRVRVRSLW